MMSSFYFQRICISTHKRTLYAIHLRNQTLNTSQCGWSFFYFETSQTSIGNRARVTNYIRAKRLDVITHPCSIFNGGLVNPPLKLRRGWMIILLHKTMTIKEGNLHWAAFKWLFVCVKNLPFSFCQNTVDSNCHMVQNNISWFHINTIFCFHDNFDCPIRSHVGPHMPHDRWLFVAFLSDWIIVFQL